MNVHSSLKAVAAAALVLAFTAGTARADESFATTGADPFAKGELVGFAGLSMGVFGVYGSMVVPPLVVGVDYAFHDYITAGGMVGYSSYDYGSGSLSYMTVVGRGTFHPTFWLKKVRVPIDPYGIAILGYSHAFWDGPGSPTYSYLIIGPGVGIRYWFTSNLSGQAESGVGNGFGLLNLSLALKL